jgi:hypothetical protein
MSILSPLTGILTALGATRVAAAITYLLRDEFTTAQAAPLTSPRTCEPGPGTLTIVDSANALSISGGVLVVNGTPGGSENQAAGASLSRVAGRAFLLRVPTRTTVSIQQNAGWRAASGVYECGGRFVSTTNFQWRSGVSAVIDSITIGSGTWYLAFILRTTGAFFLARNGASGAYTLAWVMGEGATASLIPTLMSTGASPVAVNYVLDDAIVADLPAPWDTDYGIATDRKAVSVASDQITMTADALVEHTFAAQTAVNKVVRVRQTDGSNVWRVHCIQASGTIDLREIVAGVSTTRATTAQTWANGTSYRVVIICEAATIRVYVNNVLKFTYTSATFNQTATIASVDHAGTDFVAWPRTVTLPSGV